MPRKKRRPPPPPPPPASPWQQLFITGLHQHADRDPATLHVRQDLGVGDDGWVHLTIRLNTASLTASPQRGMTLADEEEFVVMVHPAPLIPPRVYVTHARFVGYPHVLAGNHLCLYLDPAREWSPREGVSGFLNRLCTWLTDASAGNFNADAALYHAVGGVPHESADSPTLVIRATLMPNRRCERRWLVTRTPRRVDLHTHQPSDTESVPVPVFHLSQYLPLGAGRNKLQELLQLIDQSEEAAGTLQPDPDPPPRPPIKHPSLAAAAITAGHHAARERSPALMSTAHWELPTPPPQVAPRVTTALLTTLGAQAARQPAGSPQHLILAVPHPQGGPEHLLALRLPPQEADALRRAMQARHILSNLETADVKSDIEMEWWTVSDERPDVTRRRDAKRPVSAFAGKNVHIWGCGGLGSWIAEFIVRSGAAEVTLCDPGRVTGGLLVRQDYAEDDIGESKAQALANRLLALSDTVNITAHETMLPEDPLAALAADVLIDATISHAIGQTLDALAAQHPRAATIARVVTDTRTATLGMAVIVSPTSTDGVSTVDAAAGARIAADPTLDDYAVFWREPLAGDEFVPTRGCSVPTFHGSAADLAAVAGTLTSLIGQHLETDLTGTLLTALPHSGVTPAHHYIPHQPVTQREPLTGSV